MLQCRKQRALGLQHASQLHEALAPQDERVQPVDCPAVHLKERGERRLRFFRLSSALELARVVIPVPRGQVAPARAPGFVDRQVSPVALRSMLPRMAHDDVLVQHVSAHSHGLVHHAGEREARRAPHDALPLKHKRRPAVRPVGIRIRQHHRIHAVVKPGFEREELFRLPGIEHVVRVEPEDERLACVGKRRVPRVREIVLPRVVVHPVRIAPRDRLRPVGRSGIEDHDFVHRVPDALQATAQPALLVPDDHAKRQLHANPSCLSHALLLLHRVCQGTENKFPDFA